ncbi:hypothetical protein SAMN05216252_10535 [Actinacidiphila glaucinigra]|uniref:Uncharacterized protein n=1 Tax=Actinacidiphila glaucinigra TaxID=235986 RepID=A0A239DKK3_9ACTN|nr:hypothetical protein SAMN05216252_10535 [Actinacidiphila glaucinigra]
MGGCRRPAGALPVVRLSRRLAPFGRPAASCGGEGGAPCRVCRVRPCGWLGFRRRSGVGCSVGSGLVAVRGYGWPVTTPTVRGWRARRDRRLRVLSRSGVGLGFDVHDAESGPDLRQRKDRALFRRPYRRNRARCVSDCLAGTANHPQSRVTAGAPPTGSRRGNRPSVPADGNDTSARGEAPRSGALNPSHPPTRTCRPAPDRHPPLRSPPQCARRARDEPAHTHRPVARSELSNPGAGNGAGDLGPPDDRRPPEASQGRAAAVATGSS